MQTLIANIKSGTDLDETQVAEAAEGLLSEAVADGEKGEFLSALAEKGETPAEIAAFVNAFLERAVDPGISGAESDEPLIDVCGTGGDKLDLFNVSTSSVFVLAGAGLRVVKHGNRGITSKSGGADVLEALGIRIDLPPERFSECVQAVGAGFLFAPMYHPAFKAVVPVRQLLAKEGKRTIFNILGPLLNPARPSHQLIGVFDEALCPVFADILTRLGRTGAWAVHGKTETGAGMDEFSTIGPTTIVKTGRDGISTESLDPATLGLPAGDATTADLRGGDAEENAGILRGILSGEITGPKRDIVALNAAAGLTICGKTANLTDGLALANETIDSGAAARILETWRAFSA